MFDTLTKSEYSGRPLELYKFSNDDHDFRYASSTEEITYLSATYDPLEPISRKNIAQTTNVDKADLVVMLPRDAEIVREYRRTPPSPYWLTLFSLHFGDTDTKQLWQGRVLDVRSKGTVAEIRLESILTALNRMGLQQGFNVLCNNYLYDGIGCPVPRAPHARPATVTSIAADTITVSGLGAFINDWFRAGYVELADGDRRDVLKSVQATGVLTIVRSFSKESLQAGDPITVFDGCQHRWQEDCIGKFGSETNNGESHRGFPFAGARNPFKTGVQ
jgi:uncharacterized phage protein (TIGR02218 family)